MHGCGLYEGRSAPECYQKYIHKMESGCYICASAKRQLPCKCKSTLTGPACSKRTKANQDVKKEVTLGFVLLSRDFLKGKTSEKMFTLGVIFIDLLIFNEAVFQCSISQPLLLHIISVFHCCSAILFSFSSNLFHL